MRIKYVIAAFLLCCLALSGCREGDVVNNNEEITPVDDTEVIQPEETRQTEVTPEDILPEETQPVLPDVVLSLRDAEIEELPDTLELNDELSDAIAKAVAEKLPGLSICVRVTYLQCWEEGGATRFDAEYEVYPAGDTPCLFPAGSCMGSSHVGLAYTPNEGYVSAEPVIIDINAEADITRKLSEYEKDSSAEKEYLYLDKEKRVWIHTLDGDIATEHFYKDVINFLDYCVVWFMEGETIVVCGMESCYYNEALKISISRDGGENWTVTVPELEPIGIHLENGFSKCIIQLMENGRVYIFLGTNLASLTVLAISPETDEVDVLYRTQIEGYETTALTDAAMVNESRGFCTLSHPKYAGSNGIYRTTDGGESWLRCYVPVPDEVADPWDMQLYLPYQTEAGVVWYMKGEWGSGECLYTSEDGGWTWKIIE